MAKGIQLEAGAAAHQVAKQAKDTAVAPVPEASRLSTGFGYKFEFIRPDFERRLRPRFAEIEPRETELLDPFELDLVASEEIDPFAPYRDIFDRLQYRFELLRSMISDFEIESAALVNTVNVSESKDKVTSAMNTLDAMITKDVKQKLDRVENAIRAQTEPANFGIFLLAMQVTDEIYDNIFACYAQIQKIESMCKTYDSQKIGKRWNSGYINDPSSMTRILRNPESYDCDIRSVAAELDRKIVAFHQLRPGFMMKLGAVHKKMLLFRSTQQGAECLSQISELRINIQNRFEEITLHVENLNSNLEIERMSVIEILRSVMETYHMLNWYYLMLVQLDMQRKQWQEIPDDPVVEAFRHAARERQPKQ